MTTTDEIQHLYNKGIIWVERAKKLRILAEDNNYGIIKRTRFMALAAIQMKRAREALQKANDLIDESLNLNN